jgi:hypothetical protein
MTEAAPPHYDIHEEILFNMAVLCPLCAEHFRSKASAEHSRPVTLLPCRHIVCGVCCEALLMCEPPQCGVCTSIISESVDNCAFGEVGEAAFRTSKLQAVVQAYPKARSLEVCDDCVQLVPAAVPAATEVKDGGVGAATGEATHSWDSAPAHETESIRAHEVVPTTTSPRESTAVPLMTSGFTGPGDQEQDVAYDRCVPCNRVLCDAHAAIHKSLSHTVEARNIIVSDCVCPTSMQVLKWYVESCAKVFCEACSPTVDDAETAPTHSLSLIRLAESTVVGGVPEAYFELTAVPHVSSMENTPP